MGSIAQELLNAGLVREASESGRIRAPLALDPERRFVVALELTPTEVRGARVHLDGALQHAVSRPLKESGLKAAVAAAAAVARRVTGREPDAVLATVLAVTGMVDEPRGVVVRSARLWQWQDVALGDALKTVLGHRVRIVNDTFAQLWDGAWFGREFAHTTGMLYLGIGEGLSCALLVHGRPVTGLGSAAGEIGHVRAGDESRLCRCGRQDCLETYASAPAILAEMTKTLPAAKKWTSLAQAADAAERLPPVMAVIDRVAARLARQLAPVLAALAPEKVLVGCTDPRFGARLADRIQHHIGSELLGVPSAAAIFSATGPLAAATLRGAGARSLAEFFRNGVLD